MPGRAPGRITEVFDCSPVTTRAADDVDVGAGTVGDREPRAQEVGVTGAVEDAAPVEDTDRVVVGAVRQDERHLQDGVDGAGAGPDQQHRARPAASRKDATTDSSGGLALGREPAARRQPVPQDVEQARVVGGRAGGQAHGAVSSSQ